jgi:Na+/proline symporter
MHLDIDSFIFLSFLIVNLIAGVYFGRGIKDIKSYAIGNRHFSTLTIAATLVATWVSGSAFVNDLSQSYANGLYFIWAIIGNVLCFLVIGWFFAPRMGEFLGCLSIAEAMGNLYGKKVRIISAIAGFAVTCGFMEAQLKVS